MPLPKNKQFALHKTITPLSGRVIVFMCSFIIISGFVGPRIISGDIVSRDHFDVYGTLGKMVLFALIAFILLARRRPGITLPQRRKADLWWFVATALYVGLANIGTAHLLQGNREWLLATHAFILLSVISAAIGSFGWQGSRALFKNYQQELRLALGAGAAFLVLLSAIYGVWGLLATAVLHSVQHLLQLCGLTVELIPPRTLLLDKFGITIAQYCSGIESLALFSGLYAIIGFLDWEKFNHHKFVLVFPIALLGLFICNILRVFILILGGYYINPHIAFSLFHTYAGMVFFILYAAIFWKVSYAWLLQKR